MSAALKLFTEKHGEYTRFIRLMLYPQGIRAFFQPVGYWAPVREYWTQDAAPGWSPSLCVKRWRAAV